MSAGGICFIHPNPDKRAQLVGRKRHEIGVQIAHLATRHHASRIEMIGTASTQPSPCRKVKARRRTLMPSDRELNNRQRPMDRPLSTMQSGRRVWWFVWEAVQSNSSGWAGWLWETVSWQAAAREPPFPFLGSSVSIGTGEGAWLGVPSLVQEAHL